MTFKNIVVAGIVRNCEKFLIHDISRIQKALADYSDVKFLIIESDSNDNTLEILEHLKNSINGFFYISLGTLANKIPKRTERLAYCRNRYLEELENNQMYRNAEYVLITDMDGTNELLTKEGIESCQDIYNWDVCTANQAGAYYDLWALRHPLLSPNDCWKVFRFMVDELGVKSIAAKEKALKSRMFRFHKSLKPFEVDSAFGGLAIYKRHSLQNARYTGIDNNGSEVCEHVELHRQIRENGYKIFLNPGMINCYPPTQYVKSKCKKLLLGFIRRICPVI